MKSEKNNQEGSSIAAELGENFEYIKTIAINKLELAKLDAVEVFADVAGKMVLGVLALMTSMLLLVGFMLLIFFAVDNLVQSHLFSALAALLTLGLVSGTAYLLRHWLIYRPLKRIIFDLLIK